MLKKINYHLLGLALSSGIFTNVHAISMIGYDNETVGDIAEKIIAWILLFAGAVAVLFIIWGGFLYVTSAGNKDRIEQAKKTLTYAIVGLIVIILARFIVNFIDFNIGQIKKS